MRLNSKGVLTLVVLFGATFNNYACAAATNHVNQHHRNYKDAIFKDAAAKPRNHYEIIGAAGMAKLKAGNAQLNITSSETDTLVQTNQNSWNTLAGQLGVGYIYFFNRARTSNNLQWFPSIEPQLTFINW